MDAMLALGWAKDEEDGQQVLLLKKAATMAMVWRPQKQPQHCV